MSLINRIRNKIFKCYLSCSIEYHAGGFFIRKQAAYLIFDKENTVSVFERVEGLHPNDNKYDLLLQGLLNQQNVNLYTLSSVSENILILSNNDKQIKLMPAVFIENVFQDNLTEILIDNINGTSQIFNYVYAIDNTP